MIVLRGGCSFGAKAINALEARAAAVIVESDRPGPPFVVEEEADLPLLVVTDAVGEELHAYIAREGARRACASRARWPSCRRRRAFSPTSRRPARRRSTSLLKPDIAAPGEAILSSIPLASTDYPGAFASWEGTSMAAPAVTGVVALMRERHPRVDAGADPLGADRLRRPGLRRLERHDRGLAAAHRRRLRGRARRGRAGRRLRAPGRWATGCSARRSVSVPVSVSDAGDGAGVWQVRVDRHGGRAVTAPAEVAVPPAGAVLLPVALTRPAGRAEGDATGYVVLTQGERTRRIPYWAHVERPRLATATSRLLHPGIVRGTTRGQPDRVQRYRYRPTPERSDCPCAGAAARRSTASTSTAARSTWA